MVAFYSLLFLAPTLRSPFLWTTSITGRRRVLTRAHEAEAIGEDECETEKLHKYTQNNSFIFCCKLGRRRRRKHFLCHKKEKFVTISLVFVVKRKQRKKTWSGHGVGKENCVFSHFERSLLLLSCAC